MKDGGSGKGSKETGGREAKGQLRDNGTSTASEYTAPMASLISLKPHSHYHPEYAHNVFWWNICTAVYHFFFKI